MMISFIVARHDEKDVKLLKFSDDTFFYVCLPPIVFASGFNMQRANFFSNFKNISLFGIIGTFTCFSAFSLATIYAKDFSFMT